MRLKATLPSKPDVSIAYQIHYVAAVKAGPCMIVCLNNLLMPASSWIPAISLLGQQKAGKVNEATSRIPVLLYDRFGQGETTDRDPLDSRPGVEQGYGHDFLDVVHDLHELITLVAAQELPSHVSQPVRLLLVGASIGAPLARLYAQTYPGTVSGMILLDSNICNRNYSDMWPDPHAPGFDSSQVTAPDCTLEQYLESCAKLSSIYDLHVKNKEHLDRRNTPLLLPHAEEPVLEAFGGGRVKVCVVGHDAETFAEQGFVKLGVPRSFTTRWVQTAWEEYNRGLLRIGDARRWSDVVIAKGCDHFIQRDDPRLVARLIAEMVDELGW